MYSIIRGSFGVDNITKRNANHSFDEPFTVVIDNITNQENHSSEKPWTAMVDNITNHKMNHFSDKPQTHTHGNGFKKPGKATQMVKHWIC